jgi:hypothetical protein
VFLLFCLLYVFSGCRWVVGEGVEELVGTGEDFLIVATEIEMERLGRTTLALWELVETHFCHYKNYPVS